MSFATGGSTGPVDATRDVFELDSQYFLATTTSNRPFNRVIGSIGGSRYVEVLSPATNALGDGMIYPFMAPVFVITSPDPTFAFDKTGWAAPTVTNPNKKSYGVSLFGEQAFYDDGPTRVISVAYEIHNVSSVLNKQGTITVGDPGIRPATVMGTFYGGNNANNTVNPNASIQSSVEHYSLHPAGASELLAIPSSKQWSSEYGVYAVFPPTNVCNDFESPSSKIHSQSQAFYGDAECPAKAYVNVIPSGNRCAVATCTVGPVNSASSVAWGIRPTNCPGEAFSPIYTFVDGLADTSAFTITVRITYETIPFVRSPLISLARQPYNPTSDFSQILSTVFHELHPFCMVAENAKGTWFKKVMSVARTLVPVYKAARGVLPAPAQAIGDVIAAEVEKTGKKKKNKKKQAAKPQVMEQTPIQQQPKPKRERQARRIKRGGIPHPNQ